MSILDDQKQIKNLDKSRVLDSILYLPQQCLQAWEGNQSLTFPPDYQQVKNVVVAGMGGSALGVHVTKSVYKKQLKVPLQIINHYQLPNFVDSNTLVILSSYSGNTEEILAAAQEAKSRQAKLICICSGGHLAQFCGKNQLPCYQIDTKFNPASQPRTGIGSSVFGHLAIFARLKLIELDQNQVSNLVDKIKQWTQNLKVSVPSKENLAKQIAAQLQNKIIILIASEHLKGAAHVFNNQINENAKSFTCLFYLPEVNHHLMEGLSFPPNLSQALTFLFINSSLYLPRVQTRYKLTQKVIEKKHISSLTFKPQAQNPLEQAWETIVFGSFVSFYLAMLNNIDPTPIPTVDYFKKQLSNS